MRTTILRYFKERFGISKKIFSDYSIIAKKEKVWIVSKDVLEKNLEGLRIETIGLLLGRYFKRQNRLKPTTNALQIFGKYATKNVVELNEEEKEKYVRGYNLKKDLELENGYIILKFDSDILGCGLYKDGEIKNQIPKSKVII